MNTLLDLARSASKSIADTSTFDITPRFTLAEANLIRMEYRFKGQKTKKEFAQEQVEYWKSQGKICHPQTIINVLNNSNYGQKGLNFKRIEIPAKDKKYFKELIKRRIKFSAIINAHHKRLKISPSVLRLRLKELLQEIDNES